MGNNHFFITGIQNPDNIIEIYAKNNGPFTPDLGGKATTSDVIRMLEKIIKDNF